MPRSTEKCHSPPGIAAAEAEAVAAVWGGVDGDVADDATASGGGDALSWRCRGGGY